jgi:hypothetical protein
LITHHLERGERQLAEKIYERGVSAFKTDLQTAPPQRLVALLKSAPTTR